MFHKVGLRRGGVFDDEFITNSSVRLAWQEFEKWSAFVEVKDIIRICTGCRYRNALYKFSVLMFDILKAKFHYASWFEAGRRQVRSRFEAGRRLQRAEIWPII